VPPVSLFKTRALHVQVSDECKDLLRKVLMADPAQRLTIQGIMQHPWFLQDLPVGALEVNSRLKMMDNVRCALEHVSTLP
jgi:serine/threonine protein kinase